MHVPLPQAFLGDNERGRIGEHGNELEARAEADGKEKIRQRGVMGRRKIAVRHLGCRIYQSLRFFFPSHLSPVRPLVLLIFLRSNKRATKDEAGNT